MLNLRMCVFIWRLGRWVSSDYNDTVFCKGETSTEIGMIKEEKKKKDWRAKLKKSQKIKKKSSKIQPAPVLVRMFWGRFRTRSDSIGHARGRLRTRSDSIGHASQRPWTRLDEWPDPVRSRPASDTFPDPSPESDSSRFVRSLNLPNIKTQLKWVNHKLNRRAIDAPSTGRFRDPAALRKVWCCHQSSRWSSKPDVRMLSQAASLSLATRFLPPTSSFPTPALGFGGWYAACNLSDGYQNVCGVQVALVNLEQDTLCTAWCGQRCEVCRGCNPTYSEIGSQDAALPSPSVSCLSIDRTKETRFNGQSRHKHSHLADDSLLMFGFFQNVVFVPIKRIMPHLHWCWWGETCLVPLPFDLPFCCGRSPLTRLCNMTWPYWEGSPPSHSGVLKQDQPTPPPPCALDLTFLHRNLEEVQRHLLCKPHKTIKGRVGQSGVILDSIYWLRHTHQFFEPTPLTMLTDRSSTIAVDKLSSTPKQPVEG